MNQRWRGNMTPTNQIKLIIFLLVVLFIGTTAFGQVPRTLPKFIQELSDEQYEAWAGWQNQQAMRASKPQGYEPRYTGSTVTTVRRSGAHRGRVRTGAIRSRTHRRGYTRAETRIRHYPNPLYQGPRGVTLYNPYTRPTGGVGKPDWDNLYVPTEKGVTPLSEVLGSVPPEILYRKLMEVWFQ